MYKAILRTTYIFGLCVILTAGFIGCTSVRAASTDNISSAHPILNAQVKSPKKNVAPPSKKSASPKAQEVLSPAPADNSGNYFTQSGEDIKVNSAKTDWLYRSSDLYVHIVQYNKTDVVLRYFVADIRVRNGTKIQSGFSDAKHPGANSLLPYLIAQKYRAVFATNADFFEDKRNPSGVIIRNGKVYKDDKKADTLAVMPDGTLKVYSAGEINAQGLLDLGVNDTYSFGPTLINDGKINPNLDKDRLHRANPRTGIGMIEKNHYVSIVVEGRNPKESRGMTLNEFAQLFVDAGCTVAYNLDGGASAAMVFMGEVMNIPTDILTTKTYRRVPDILMIGASDAVSGFNPADYTSN
jgi:exopolysaccharide biosynthesis protein